MSRPLRIQYPGAWYHVMNRGRRREQVFRDQKDFEHFLSLLQEAGNNWNCRIAAYCLMSNHYHLLLQTPDANISRIMRHINGVYTQHFNRRHRFNGEKLKPVFGKDAFVKWVKAKFSDKKNTKEIPEAKHLHHDPDTIKNGVCDHYGLDEGMLYASKRGTSNLPRSVAIYLLRTQGGKTLVEIGHIFSIQSYSSVSSIIQRLKTAMTNDEKLRKQVNTIITKLNKSQEQT